MHGFDVGDLERRLVRAEISAEQSRGNEASDGSPRSIYWLRFLPAPAATAAPVTPTTLPNAIRSRSRSIGPARERWPAGSYRGRTNILARMEPVRATPTDPRIVRTQ